MRSLISRGRRLLQPGDSLTPTQNHIREVFDSQVYLEDSYDVQKGHIWDSLTIDAGEQFNPHWAGFEFFSIPQGHLDPRGIMKTSADTSMDHSKILLAPSAFAIRRIIFTFSRTAAEEDVYAIAEGTVWALYLGNKFYLKSPIISLQMIDLPKAPIRICVYCRSVYVIEARCPGCGAQQFNLSDIGGAAGRSFVLDIGQDSPGIVIENEISFYIKLEGEPRRVSEALKLWVHFEGLHARGIQ